MSEMAATRKVFLSSTGLDLRKHREAVAAAIRKLGDWEVVSQETFGASNWSTDGFCRKEVRKCDLFIGLIGHRFGDAAPGTKESFTQREYRASSESPPLPRLLYVAEDGFPIPAKPREAAWKLKAQDRFREDILGTKDPMPFYFGADASTLAERVIADIHRFEKEERHSADPTRYLEWLRQDTANIDIRGLRVGGGSVYQFPIEDLYTPLTTVLALEERESKSGSDAQVRSTPLQEALKNPRVVLVGDPGAGKSTFVRRIAFAASKALLETDPKAAEGFVPVKPCPLPLLIRAASLAEYIRKHSKDGPADTDDPEWLVLYLDQAAHNNNWNLDAGFFRERLNDGCLLFLDGLDEVPGRIRRKAVAHLLERASRAYGKTRVVATSRPPAYGGETMIPGFVTIQIADLEDSAIEAFTGKWCRALYNADEAANKHQSELLGAIRSKPEIRRMAVNPVMLTALAALHWNQKRLPDQRSELYSSVLTWLAESREVEAGRSAVQCLQLMRRLAFAMHCDPSGKLVEISLHTAADKILAPEFREYAGEPDKQLDAAKQFLENEENDSGIVIRRGDVLRFWHLTFEEYLTAEMLAVREADRQRLLFGENKLYLPEWRETVLLLAGVLCKQDRERADALLGQMLDKLGKDPKLAERAKCVGLIGQILKDLKAWNYRTADPRYQQNLDQCLRIFDGKAARSIPFETRLEAADALGQAGDPRLDEENWVRVEGGPFWMGAQSTDPKGRNYDLEAQAREAPVRQVEVAPFLIGRYPVTVAEYERFVRDGGYQQARFWSAGGFKVLTAPLEWQHQLQYPTRPVVGVSWYEAAAYCAWNKGRLPSEAEWECAARCGRESIRYPWGDEQPDEHRANFGMNLTHPTPVGLYPTGATPSGIHDLAGNVFEWVELDMSDRKPARGGSCYGGPEFLRVSSRPVLDVSPGTYLGFRCVRELPRRF
jgi:formylglycine-generating enzyme required for sulfatase activity